MNANKTMDDCKRGFVGVSANFAVTAVLPLNAASIRSQPLHPTSPALMPPPAALAADRRETNHVDDRGGHEVAEHEEQRRDAKRSRAERSDVKRSRDVGTDWAMDD